MKDPKNIIIAVLFLVCGGLGLAWFFSATKNSKALEAIIEKRDELKEEKQKHLLQIKNLVQENSDYIRKTEESQKLFDADKKDLDDEIEQIPDKVAATFAMPLDEQLEFWTRQAEQPDLSPIRLDLPAADGDLDE